MKLSHLSVAVFSAIALAACGGSGSDHTKTHGGGTPGGTPGDDGNTTTPTTEISSDVFAALTNVSTPAAVGVRVFNGAAAGTQLPDGQGTNGAQAAGGTSIQVAAPQDSIQGLATQNAFIQNSDLYNESGNLDQVAADPTTAVTDVFYKVADGVYTAAFAAQANGTAPVKYYKDDGTGNADLTAPLAASELYQAANNNFTTVTGYKVFDAFQKRPSNSTNAYPAIDRSKIETGKVLTSDVKANVQYSAQKIAPVNSAGTAQATNQFQITSDSNGIVIQDNKEFKAGSVKAYNLPHSLTTVSLNNNGALNGTGYFVGNYQGQGQNATGNNVGNPANAPVQISGLRTLDLPQNVSATYTGKVFTPKSEADLSLDVTFGTTNSAYVKNVAITNRMEGTTKLADLKGQAPAAVNYSGAQGSPSADDYTVVLVGADGTTPAGVEYNRLGGRFYGPKAEETAGQVYQNGQPASVGAYAAQRGELK